jgi:hypothetical protein
MSGSAIELVYNGTNTSITVSELQAYTTYSFAVEFANHFNFTVSSQSVVTTMEAG